MAETANIAMPPTPAADVENAPAGMLRLFLNSDAGDALYTKDESGVVTPVGNNTDPYAPGVPADWNPAPATDTDALDQLGARTSTDLVIGTVASAYANYFTTWAAAYARATLAAATGPVTIWLAEDVTAPADFLGYNLQNRINVRGLPSNPNFPTLTFASGATVRNWAQVSELALVGSNVVSGGVAVQNFFFRNVEVRSFPTSDTNSFMLSTCSLAARNAASLRAAAATSPFSTCRAHPSLSFRQRTTACTWSATTQSKVPPVPTCNYGPGLVLTFRPRKRSSWARSQPRFSRTLSASTTTQQR